MVRRVRPRLPDLADDVLLPPALAPVRVPHYAVLRLVVLRFQPLLLQDPLLRPHLPPQLPVVPAVLEAGLVDHGFGGHNLVGDVVVFVSLELI